MTPLTTVEKLANLTALYDRVAFAAKYPSPALVIISDLESGVKGEDDETQRVVRLESTRPTPDSSATQRALEPVGSSEVIFIAKSDRNPFEARVTLGRAESNDVFLQFDKVSRLHGSFMRGAVGWTFTDEHSTNGTRVDGQRLQAGESTPLRDGAILRFGPEVTARFYTPNGLFSLLVRHAAGGELSPGPEPDGREPDGGRPPS